MVLVILDEEGGREEERKAGFRANTKNINILSSMKVLLVLYVLWLMIVFLLTLFTTVLARFQIFPRRKPGGPPLTSTVDGSVR